MLKLRPGWKRVLSHLEKDISHVIPVYTDSYVIKICDVRKRFLNISDVRPRYADSQRSGTGVILPTSDHTCYMFRCYSQNKGYINLFDEQGRIIPPPDHLDYFSVFGLKKSFAVDTAELSLVYKALQRQLHPDRFSLKDEEEKEVSDRWSSLVNNAYNWLLKPLPRALYLLELLDCPLQEGTITVDNMFLMEMMELNEEVAEAGQPEIVALGKDIRQRLEERIEKIETLFRNNDLEGARKEVAHMKYLANILDKIIETETKLQLQ